MPFPNAFRDATLPFARALLLPELPRARSSTIPIVCIDCRYIRNRPSGISVVVQELVNYAPILAPDLTFRLLKHPEAPARISIAPNVEETVLAHAANGPVTMWALPAVTSFRDVALYHGTFNIMPAGLKVPTVTTIHDTMWLDHPEWAASHGWRGRVDRLFYRHGIRRAIEQSSLIATVSTATRNDIAAIAPLAADRLRVTRSGVSADFHPIGERRTIADWRRQLGCRSFVLTVGQFSPYKNQEAALRAFAQAFAADPGVHHVFVQRRGAGESALMPIAKALGVAERVHFLPQLSEDELVALYNDALVLLHPSLREGFGNPLAEAMACGLPVVTSNVSAMPEVTGGAALVAAPDDIATIAASLRRIADDPRLALDLRQRGLERAAELDWRNFALANIAVYRELL